MAVQSSSSRAEREAHYASCKYEFLIVSFLYYFICKKRKLVQLQLTLSQMTCFMQRF